MQSILDRKLEIKNKIEEYIINFYWYNGKHIRFKDIKDKFHIHCSEGSIANYLQELQDEKKIHKWYENNTCYYGPPKKHLATKYFIIFTAITLLIAVPLYNMLFYVTSFYIGGVLTTFFWRFFTKKHT